MKYGKFLLALFVVSIFSGFTNPDPSGERKAEKKKKVTKVWLIGDSTVADYSLDPDYMKKKYPMKGWGQVLQPFLSSDSLKLVSQLIKADSAFVVNKAMPGRSTRSFFEESRWSEVYNLLGPGDIVMIQFGHNDASVAKGERYTGIPGFKEFLRLYVNQTRQKGAIPILITPVARNYPWEEGKLKNTHGDYPEAMRSVAQELNVCLIDLGELSMAFFSSKGQEYSTYKYFMNIDSGKYEAYPAGSKDNTHFQPEGAIAVATLVFNEMKKLTVPDIDQAGDRKKSK